MNESSINYVSLTGGIGNQLFQVAASLSPSEFSKPVLVSSLGRPNLNKDGKAVCFEMLSSNLFSDFYQEKFNFFQEKYHNLLLRTTKRSNNDRFNYFVELAHSWLVRLSPFIIRKIPRVVAPFDSGFEDITRAFKSSNFLIGYFQSPKFWDSETQAEIRRGVRLQEFSAEINELKNIASRELPLVVHVRLGDYIEFSEFGTLSSEYYKNSIDTLWKTGRFKKIWVFTNSPERVASYLPLEYEKVFRYINVHGGSAAHNLEAMRLGRGYIISNSTYSWWGAYLSYDSDAVVVAPDVWFKDLPEPNSLLPKSWMRMKATHE